MTKKGYLLIAIALCLVILSSFIIWALREKQYNPSDRAEIYSISGGESGLFKEVIFDPYILTSSSEKQFIVVMLKDLDKIKNFSVILEDEEGTYKKKFRQFSEIEGIVTYIVNWTPKEIISSKYYPVIFEYITIKGETNSMKLFWHSKLD